MDADNRQLVLLRLKQTRLERTVQLADSSSKQYETLFEKLLAVGDDIEALESKIANTTQATPNNKDSNSN